ncbi:MAG: hypothetical protein ONB05_11225 [candidate division KSB1 bacterium]|nr:hypothetical protein [candidate division KSB1 bacterium]
MDSKSAASQKRMPGLRIVTTSIPSEANVKEQIEAGINEAMDRIIDALTKPLTAEEESPQPKEAEKPPRIVFKGNLYEVNRFFYQRGWTDGLPIIPPTEEAVAEMLTGTDLPADHVVAKLIVRLGKATIEKIAINAVMAGALPTYMPVLVAGVQALADPTSGFVGFGFSAGSWAPFYIINGPIRNDINVNCSHGALSPGNIANAAIGRAMGLIVKNIGGVRKGIEDMGTLGNPGKYSMVLGENEEESPWEPMHVSLGYQKEESTITVSAPNSWVQNLPYRSNDEGVLSCLVDNLRTMVTGQGRGNFTIVLTPDAARLVANGGWKKKEVLDLLAKLTWPVGPLPLMTVGNQIYSYFIGDIHLRLVVAGGGQNQIGVFRGFGHTTKKINLPSNWNKLVAKYKGIVPTYVMY